MAQARVSAGRPSVLDVAAACGVSPSTVCRALNSRADINEATRAQILAACTRLGFTKNSAASVLRRRQSDVVACLMPDLGNELFMEKLHVLKAAVRQAGYGWRLYTYQDTAEAARLLSEITGTRPSGLILGAALTAEQRRFLLQNGLPTVAYDRDEPGLDGVVLDREPGVFEVVDHMLAQGRRRLLMLGFGLDSERGRGCRRALAKHGLPVDETRVWNVPFGRDLYGYGYEQTRAAAARLAFDAVHAVNDAAATGVLRALHELGRPVPQAVAVSGFDDILVAAHTIPSLTTVAQPKEEMASAAVQLLQRRIRDPRLCRQVVALATRAVIRESG